MVNYSFKGCQNVIFYNCFDLLKLQIYLRTFSFCFHILNLSNNAILTNRANNIPQIVTF